MSTVSARLTAYRKGTQNATAAERISNIKAMDLATLEQEVIAFGKAKLGVPFPIAFEDNSWTDWFIKTYEWSGKESHVKFITYVEKRLDQEAHQEQAGHPMAKTKAKATAKKSAAKPPTAAGRSSSEQSWTQIPQVQSDSDWDAELEMAQLTQQAEIEEKLIDMAHENHMLNQRMTGVEMALQELIQHVKGMSVKTEQ